MTPERLKRIRSDVESGPWDEGPQAVSRDDIRELLAEVEALTAQKAKLRRSLQAILDDLYVAFDEMPDEELTWPELQARRTLQETI